MSRENSEEIARRLGALLGGTPASNVTPIRPIITQPQPAAPAPPRAPSGGGFTLLHHAECSGELPARIEDLESGRYVGEVKEDGDRFHLYCGVTPYPQRESLNKSPLLSRHHSTHDNLLVDRSQEYPQFTGIDWQAKGLKGTVFDGELMRRSEQLEYVIFDLPFYRGLDMRQIPYTERRKLLEHAVAALGMPLMRPIERRTSGLYQFFQEVVARGGEGLVIKDSYGVYGQGWAKMKKCYPVSCIVTGKKAGRGANASTFGSLALSVYHNGALVEVGYVAIQERALRERIAANFSAYQGKVIDVLIQEIHAPSAGNPCGRFRHASYDRFRDDIDVPTVTFEKLKRDLKKPPRYMR